MHTPLISRKGDTDMTATPPTRTAHSLWLTCLLLGAVLPWGGLAQAEPCALSVSQPSIALGNLTYPRVAPGHAIDAPHELGTRQITVQLHCVAESPLNLMLRGIRQADGVRFAERGALNMQVFDALLDGRPVMLQATDQLPAASNAGAPRVQVLPGQRVIPMQAGQPARGSQLTVQMAISTTLPLDELVSRDRKTLSGRIELEANVP